VPERGAVELDFQPLVLVKRPRLNMGEALA
jgi:hypothetical protein